MNTLTLEMLPPPNASLEELSAFALSFDGYAWGGGGPAELCAKLESLDNPEGLCLEELVDAGKVSIPDAVIWLRADLFLEQRSARWDSCGPGMANWALFREKSLGDVDLLRKWLSA